MQILKILKMYILYNFLNLVAYCKNTLYGTFIKYVLLTLQDNSRLSKILGVADIYGFLTASINLNLISHPHRHHSLASGWKELAWSLLVHLPADFLLTNGIPQVINLPRLLEMTE